MSLLESMKPNISVLTLIALSCVVSAGAYADEVYLKNGDRITGIISEERQSAWIVETESMGSVIIQKVHVDKIISTIPKEDLQETEKPATKSPWQVELEAGMDRRRGNSSSTEAMGKFKFNRRNDHDEWTFMGKGYYSEQDRKMNSRKYGGSGRYAFSFGPDLKWYRFTRLEADHDRFANVKFRTTPSVGLGYWFSDADDFKLMTELGVGVTYTDDITGFSNQTELEMIPRLYFKKAIFENSALSENFSIYPSVTESGDYRFISETQFEHPLNRHLSLRLSLLNEYNSNPGPDTKSNDLRFTTSVAWSH